MLYSRLGFRLGSPITSPHAMYRIRWVFILRAIILVKLAVLGSSWCPDKFIKQANRGFEQRTDRFWRFEEQSNSWVEVQLPYDLISCVNGNCTVVGSIAPTKKSKEEDEPGGASRVPDRKTVERGRDEENQDPILPRRKRISVTKISELSIFSIGESGAIYQRFWNGVQWVLSPHELPVSAGYPVSVFLANRFLLALSETGDLYQMLAGEGSVVAWVEFDPAHSRSTSQGAEPNSVSEIIKSGSVSHDGTRIYFCTNGGSLIELAELEPPRWVNHGRPPGAKVAVIANTVVTKQEVVFTISSTGELYEYDRNTKPSWKKHIWSEATGNTSLLPSPGWSSSGLAGANSLSIFLLTKDGKLVERQLNQRKWKWKWIVHGSPIGYRLMSITPASQEELNSKSHSLFFTTDTGSIFEYQLTKHSSETGCSEENVVHEKWMNHGHPHNARAARGVAGTQLHIGRMIFALHDGRLAELHLPGLGGENSGPTPQVSVKRKATLKYLWSILDAPETEGWNMEYCSEERGPTNCLVGINDESDENSFRSVVLRRRKGGQVQNAYLPLSGDGSKVKYLKEDSLPKTWTHSNFHLRVLHEGVSFFVVTDDGYVFECINAENVCLWLRHEHSMAMDGALGAYNESLFFVDGEGSLFMRQRSSRDLAWVNCTAMRKGVRVSSGPPWNRMQGKVPLAMPRDCLFFVSKKGRLLQFNVALGKYSWKDCQNPLNSKIACIIDQEAFREQIVFVLGRNGRLYQYNKVTELWHEHYQSRHLVLSRSPGTTMRPSSESLTGSLFMLSQDGGLVEYHWDALDGWKWVEHGTPEETVMLMTAPGPCIDGKQLFLIGSDGKVYLRYMDRGTWKWRRYGFPHKGNVALQDQNGSEVEVEDDVYGNCDWKVEKTRPVPFSNDAVIFELRDHRLAEMRKVEGTRWKWSRTISTPSSMCTENYWIALA